MLQRQLPRDENVAEEADADIELLEYNGSQLGMHFVALLLQALETSHYTVDQVALDAAEALEQTDSFIFQQHSSTTGAC
jgi:hypothetical protein